jgi:ACS family hexuronate transporter-like MFS transporter
VVKLLLTQDPESWRRPFLVIGIGGCSWIFFWLLSVRPRDLRAPAPARSAEAFRPVEEDQSSFLEVILSARFLSLAIMVVCINLNWHLFRVWLPLFLQEARDYSENEMFNFTTWYFVAADIGSLTAGALSGWLAHRGFSVFGARMSVFAGCCLLTLLTTAAAFLPAGPLLLATLLAVAFGGLGLFTAYYSLTQDLSQKHQGKNSGLLATITWLVTAAFHPLFGAYLDRTKNYDLVVGAMGWLPLLALGAVLLLWNRHRNSISSSLASAGGSNSRKGRLS